jgi:hypothetical protein
MHQGVITSSTHQRHSNAIVEVDTRPDPVDATASPDRRGDVGGVHAVPTAAQVHPITCEHATIRRHEAVVVPHPQVATTSQTGPFDLQTDQHVVDGL